jgi:dTDP-4-amino-4,6-dideoxygalactose transaminase
MLTLFRQMGYDIADYPQAYANYVHEISLPCYPQLNEEMTAHVVQTVINAYHTVIG